MSRRWGTVTLGFVIFICLFARAIHAQNKATPARSPWTTSRITGAPEPPAPYQLVSAFPKVRFQKPTSIEALPYDRLLITEIGGKIFTMVQAAGVLHADLAIDLAERLPESLAGSTVSLLDAELHPQFRENRYVYVCYVHPGDGGQTRVSRFVLTRDSPPRFDRKSEQVVITWPSGGHNGGCLEFGTDGYLYIATGDGSGPNPPDGLTTGQTVSDLLGALLRIDVDRATGDRPYSIPADNPFVDLKGARPEIWSYGLRNPFKFGIDQQNGDVFVADNGWESWEMVHRIVRGGNCGWPIMEGRVALRPEVKPGPTPIRPPVKDHSHTEANSVIGGPIYRGDKLPGLDGWFIYGDYITGTIWALRRNPNDSYEHMTLVDTDQRIVAFTQTNKGELFVLDYDYTGQIYELVPSELKDTSARFPHRLSETGLFTSLETMEPAPGVVPYEVQVERWMDGARGTRWVAIPGSEKITLSTSATEPATYPPGTVLVKQLTLPEGADVKPIRLETQLLHYEQGRWHPYSYLWDDAGHEAWLVESIGKNRPLRVSDVNAPDGVAERTWHVNAVNECKLCHNAESGFVLGFVPNQLNRLVPDEQSRQSNQSLQLAAEGVLSQPPQSASDLLRLVDPHDPAQSLDDRARSYLHVNCGMCHQPDGNAIVSFYLRRDLPFDKLNTNKGTRIGTFGMRDAKIIVPGDPYRSVLMYRFSKLGYARMPYIGSQVVDHAGVALIDQWIRTLSGESTEAAVSAPVTAGSTEYQAVQLLQTKDSAPRERREAAVRALIQSTEGALALVAQMHRGSLSNEDLQLAARVGSADPRSDIRGLFETFLPESNRRPTLGPNVKPEAILSRQGDPQRGKLIYFSDGARCRTCHEVADRDQSLGPTLQEINKKYPRAEELLQHVLQPSLKVDEPLAAYAVITRDGRALNGLLMEQNDKEIVMKTTEKKVVRMVRDEIEELRKSDKSLMPDFILSDLTAQEAADLLEYVRAQKEMKDEG